MIGPPMLTDSSKSFSVLFASRTPRSCSSGVRLSPSMLSFAKNPARSTVKSLPPSFGMTFNAGPSALVSAEMPLVCSTISSMTAALIW